MALIRLYDGVYTIREEPAREDGCMTFCVVASEQGTKSQQHLKRKESTGTSQALNNATGRRQRCSFTGNAHISVMRMVSTSGSILALQRIMKESLTVPVTNK